MDHLSATLKRGNIKDLLAFFPVNRREPKFLEEHFKKEGLTQVADWWAKKQYAVVKESIISELKELCEREETPEHVCPFSNSSSIFTNKTQIVSAIKTLQEESPIPEAELVQCIWQGLMGSVDWSARPDQIESLALREVGVRWNYLVELSDH